MFHLGFVEQLRVVILFRQAFKHAYMSISASNIHAISIGQFPIGHLVAGFTLQTCGPWFETWHL